MITVSTNSFSPLDGGGGGSFNLACSRQWQVFHPIRKILGLASQRDHFQILDALSNGDSELMGIDNASKPLAALLAL
jgi:hypothetical protein